jgi:type 1 glutamine amidotransferase
MFSSSRRLLFLLCLFLSAVALHGQAQFKALLVTKTQGWHHDALSAAVPAMRALANRHSFQLDRYQDGEKLTSEQLVKYDVIILLSTTGDIFDLEEQAAFEQFIQAGNGFVGIHAAADTEYEWEWYNQLVGRMFRIHPLIQTAMIEVENANFPGLAQWPQRMMWTDEWYEFDEEKTTGLNYLLTVDESTFDPKADWGRVAGDGMGDFHPIAWYHEFDGGRSFYTALGHMPEVYSEKDFLDHVFGGIYWAATGKGLK